MTEGWALPGGLASPSLWSLTMQEVGFCFFTQWSEFLAARGYHLACKLLLDWHLLMSHWQDTDSVWWEETAESQDTLIHGGTWCNIIAQLLKHIHTSFSVKRFIVSIRCFPMVLTESDVDRKRLKKTGGQVRST